MAGMHGAPPAWAEKRSLEPVFRPGPNNRLALAAKTKQVQHVADLTADNAYLEGDPAAVAIADIAGARTLLVVPMLKDELMIGALGIYREEVRPFSDKQIALLTNFAAQAVIAIENTRLLNELRQSLEQQTATSEVLQVISSSPGTLQPVFEAMLEHATRICEATFGSMLLREGNMFRRVALHNAPQHYAEHSQKTPLFGASQTLIRLLEAKQAAQVADMAVAEPASPIARLGRARTLLNVPMIKENEVIGVIGIYRQEVRPFTEKQIELVTNFAAQAVIAIENTRLLNELRESLQQQTATADVLKIISSSPSDLQPVFEAMLGNATRICQSKFGVLWLAQDDGFRPAAIHNLPPALTVERRRNQVMKPVPEDPLGQLAAEKQILHILDCQTVAAYQNGFGPFVALVDDGGARTLLVVPLLREEELLGAFAIFRQEVRPFTDKQIELVTSFAAQAVIAIENARLLNELRESLQQQTATADVLKVISRSAFDLQPVFKTVAESSVKLCGADKAFIFRYDGEMLRMVASYNSPPEFVEWVAQHPIRPGRHSGSARAALELRTIHSPDVRADPEYTYGAKSVEDIRTILGVPILKGKQLLGVIMIYRLEVNPFSEKQIALVETFADQAAIAIENVRLFDEVQARTEELSESLRQQTATAEVLKTISRAAFDLQRVLETLLENAVRICGAKHGMIFRYDGECCRAAAAYNTPPGYLELWEGTPIRAGRGTTVGRALLECHPVQIPDVLADPEYDFPQAQELMGFRTVLAVPLLREGVPLGTIGLWKTEVAPFTDKQIELITTFADQAVIAIENVRLFDEIQDKNCQLQLASEHKSQFLASMSHELRTPLNAIIGLTEMMVTNAARFGTERAQEPLQRVNRAGTHLLGLINQVLDLSKIEAGMLELNPQTVLLAPLINEVIGTAAQLAVQNNNRLIVNAQQDLGVLTVDSMRLRQILLNLLSNACKFTKA